MSISTFPTKTQPARVAAALDRIAESARVPALSFTDPALKAAIADRIRAKYAQPFTGPTDAAGLAHAYGTHVTQIHFLRDALLRYGQHHAWCATTHAGRCTCGLDAALTIGDAR